MSVGRYDTRFPTRFYRRPGSTSRPEFKARNKDSRPLLAGAGCVERFRHRPNQLPSLPCLPCSSSVHAVPPACRRSGTGGRMPESRRSERRIRRRSRLGPRPMGFFPTATQLYMKRQGPVGRWLPPTCPQSNADYLNSRCAPMENARDGIGTIASSKN